MNNDPYERLIDVGVYSHASIDLHINNCEMIRTHWEKKYAKLEAASIAVVRAASIGDQNFINCLQPDEAKKLRHTLGELTDVLKDE